MWCEDGEWRGGRWWYLIFRKSSIFIQRIVSYDMLSLLIEMRFLFIATSKKRKYIGIFVLIFLMPIDSRLEIIAHRFEALIRAEYCAQKLKRMHVVFTLPVQTK